MVLGMFAKIKERTSVVSHATSPSWASLATLAAALRLLRALRLAHTPPCAWHTPLPAPGRRSYISLYLPPGRRSSRTTTPSSASSSTRWRASPCAAPAPHPAPTPSRLAGSQAGQPTAHTRLASCSLLLAHTPPPGPHASPWATRLPLGSPHTPPPGLNSTPPPAQAARKAAISGNEPSDAVRVVNALLTQLDGLKRYKNALVVTTSNLTVHRARLEPAHLAHLAHGRTRPGAPARPRRPAAHACAPRRAQGAIDAAFVDRADIKQYIGPPGLGARPATATATATTTTTATATACTVRCRYDILTSCLLELRR